MKPELAAKQLVDDLQGDHDAGRDPEGASVSHALWMLIGIADGYVQHEKAHRWLGYAQAILILSGEYSLVTMKDINKRAV